MYLFNYFSNEKYFFQIFINFLRKSYSSCLLVSEEMDNVVEVETEKSGRFVVCFDPLDGSNNIDCLATVGSIYAIYRRTTTKGKCFLHALHFWRQYILSINIYFLSETILHAYLWNFFDKLINNVLNKNISPKLLSLIEKKK